MTRVRRALRALTDHAVAAAVTLAPSGLVRRLSVGVRRAGLV